MVSGGARQRGGVGSAERERTASKKKKGKKLKKGKRDTTVGKEENPIKNTASAGRKTTERPRW